MYSEYDQYQSEDKATYFNSRAAPDVQQPVYAGMEAHTGMQNHPSFVATTPEQSQRNPSLSTLSPMPHPTPTVPPNSMQGARSRTNVPTPQTAQQTYQQMLPSRVSPFASGKAQPLPVTPNHITGEGVHDMDAFCFCTDGCPTAAGLHTTVCQAERVVNWMTPPLPRSVKPAKRTSALQQTAAMSPGMFVIPNPVRHGLPSNVMLRQAPNVQRQPFAQSGSQRGFSTPSKPSITTDGLSKHLPVANDIAQAAKQVPVFQFSSPGSSELATPPPNQKENPAYNFSDREFWSYLDIYLPAQGGFVTGIREELFLQRGDVADQILRQFGLRCLERPQATPPRSSRSNLPKQTMAQQQLAQPHQHHTASTNMVSKMVGPDTAGSRSVHQPAKGADATFDAARQDAQTHNTPSSGLSTEKASAKTEDKVIPSAPMPDAATGGAFIPPKAGAATNSTAMASPAAVGCGKLKIESDDWTEVEKKIDEVAQRYYNVLDTDFDRRPAKVQKFIDDLKAEYTKKQTEALNAVRDALSTSAGRTQVMNNCKALAICTVDTHKVGIPTQTYNILQKDWKKLDTSLRCSEGVGGVEGALKANKRLALDITQGIKYAEIVRSPQGTVDAMIETCRSNFVREKGMRDAKSKQQAEAKELAELKARQQEDAKELAELRAKQKVEPSSQTGVKRKRSSKAESDLDHDDGIAE